MSTCASRKRILNRVRRYGGMPDVRQRILCHDAALVFAVNPKCAAPLLEAAPDAANHAKSASRILRKINVSPSLSERNP